MRNLYRTHPSRLSKESFQAEEQMQRQRPWQQPTLWQDAPRRKKVRWIPLSILLAVLVVLLAAFLGMLSRTPPGQATQTPTSSTTLMSRVTYQTPTYSAVKGMWL